MDDDFNTPEAIAVKIFANCFMEAKVASESGSARGHWPVRRGGNCVLNGQRGGIRMAAVHAKTPR
jgi:hypothetical protein